MTNTAMEAVGLGKKFGRRGSRGLRDCTFRLPAGCVCAVVGPNGAGKSTLFSLAAGLEVPTEGALEALGEQPGAVRARIGYVAQDKPLYPQLTIAETLRAGAELNPARWDADAAERIVAGGDLNPRSRVRSLSGGQRTRVALALALAKRPELLLLDEPMADLDPLARHELMGLLMTRAAEHGITVVMSSHVVAELDDVCDHLLLLRDGSVQLDGGTDDLLQSHALAIGPADAADQPAPHTVVESHRTGRQLTALLRTGNPAPEGWRSEQPSLEELVLAYLRAPQSPAAPSAPAETQEAAV